jgi:probable HAF family extracellular repeat protein
MSDGIGSWARLMARKALAVGLALAVVGATGVSPAPAQNAAASGSRCRPPAGYTNLDVGALGTGSTLATDLNDRGVVVGGSETATGVHAFVWSRGRLIDLTPPGSVFSGALGISDRDQVLHQWFDPAAGAQRAALWRHGRSTAIDTGPGDTVALALNERGEVLLYGALWRRGLVEPIAAPAGFSLITSHLGDRGHVVGGVVPDPGPGGGHPTPATGFVWRRGVLTEVVPQPPQRSIRQSIAVNDAGQALFDAYGPAVLWDGARIVELGSLGGPTTSTFGTDLDDRTQVVGSSTTASGDTHAFLWDDGRITDLHPVAGVASSAQVINDRGVVAGHVEGRGTVTWTCGHMVDVGVSGTPIAINERGQIASWVGTPTGATHTVLSTPLHR